MKSDKKRSILIVDDKENLSASLVPQLKQVGFEVQAVGSIDAALERLRHPAPAPTFILADRIMGEPIETRNLARLCDAAPGSKVIVYTAQDLTDDERYAVLRKGAFRLLDKNIIDQFASNIDYLTQELDELTALSDELARATSERSKIMAALAGIDASVSVVDNQLHRWFHSGDELLGGGACRNQCWSASTQESKAPATCWGCAVADVFRHEEAVDRLFLNQFNDGSLGWIEVHATPIYADGGTAIIAAREAVTRVNAAALENLGRERRLYHIAESLIRVGFGRARIYRAESEKIRLVAAASRSDEPGSLKSQYFESMRDVALNINDCPYMRRATEEHVALLTRDWDQEGPCPHRQTLGLEPPYFDVPVWRDDGTLIGWIAADFVGMGALPRRRAIQRLTRDSRPAWLEDGYANEVRLAFDTVGGKPEYRERLEIAQRARLGIVGAGSVDQAIREIRRAFQELLPRCRVSVRIRKGNILREFDSLCWGDPPSDTEEGSPSVIRLDEPNSLSVTVISSPKAIWQPDYARYIRSAAEQGDPRGFVPRGTKSTAQIPLRFETTAFGTLSINSPDLIDWEAERYKEPLIALAETTALVLRDLALAEERDKAVADRAAIVAYSVNSSADALWRHWTQQRLAEASALLALARRQIETNSVIDSEEATQFLLKLSSIITRIHTERPEREPSPGASVAATFKRLEQIYINEQPSPRFEYSQDYTLRMPEFILRNILGVLIDNALKAIRQSGCGSSIAVQLHADVDALHIDIIDDGPGVPGELRSRVLREPLESASGRGIGLLYARGAALQYDGDLQLSPSERGAHFVLRLPMMMR